MSGGGEEMRFETRAIHVGQDPDAEFGSVNVPIYQTSTYAQPAVGKPKAWDYARAGNPTREALQQVLASLEGGSEGLCFSSGLGATTTLLLTLKPGDHVLISDDVYGGTYRLLARVMDRWGLAFDTVDMTDLIACRSVVREDTALVWVESPTNPFLKVVDIAAVAELAHRAGARCVVDNTFATPYLQRPLELGADVVLHSMTKYLGGHSDLIGGALVTSDDELHERLAFLVNAAGAVPGPMDCYLALRGVKTLALRMEAHCRGAKAIAEFLQTHPRVTRVHFPGLPGHPGFEVAVRQMRDFGGMVSFEVESRDEAVRIVESTELFFLAESLGGVESLIELPGPDDPRERLGFADRGARHADPALGRDRAPRRPRRRPGAGPRLTRYSITSSPPAVTIATRRIPGGSAVTRIGSSSPPSHSRSRASSPPISTQAIPSARTPWPARPRPGCSSAGMSHVRKNGIHGSRLGSSSPAIRQRTTSPSGRSRVPASISSPSRSPISTTSSLAAAIAYQPSPAVVRSSTERPKPVRAASSGSTTADQLQVLVAERHDAVRGAPPLVSSTDRRVEPECLPEAHRGRVQIADGVDDVIEAEHEPNPNEGAP